MSSGVVETCAYLRDLAGPHRQSPREPDRGALALPAEVDRLTADVPIQIDHGNPETSPRLDWDGITERLRRV